MSQEPSTNGRLKRGTERVLLQLPITVTGTDTEGKSFQEKTRTIVINRNGARICLKAKVRTNDRIAVKNLQSELSCPFRVVVQLEKSLTGQPEWGIECLEPEINFWGILFPKKSAPLEREETVDALLECGVCKSRELAHLSFKEYRSLVEQANLNRYCTQCDDSTDWVFGFVQEELTSSPQPAGEGGAKSSDSGGAERRRAKRLTAKLPLRIRLEDGREEVTRTEDLSKTGVRFYSHLKLVKGDAIRLSVGASLDSPGTEIAAKVMWGRATGGDDHFLYGAHLSEKA